MIPKTATTTYGVMHLDSDHDTKVLARVRRNALRAEGYRARVIMKKGRHCVYRSLKTHPNPDLERHNDYYYMKGNK